jgi:hypothetical protein
MRSGVLTAPGCAEQAATNPAPLESILGSYRVYRVEFWEMRIGRSAASRTAIMLAALRPFDGNMPTVTEAKIAKSYLEHDELYSLHILCEQFLLLVESKAFRNQQMIMKELARKLDDIMALNDYPIFPGYKGKYDKDLAMKHATEEYARFLVRLRKEDLQALH